MDKSTVRKLIAYACVYVFVCCKSKWLFATQVEHKLIKIAVISPLYLDTLYNTETLGGLGVTEYVDFLKNGWDFYIGFKIAVDSLIRINENLGTHVEFYYYDIKNIVTPTGKDLSQKFKSIDYQLIIGTPTRNDLSLIADYAHDKKILFISVLSPQIIKEKKFPLHIVLNPTIETHITELIKYLYAQNSSTIKIVVQANEDNAIILETINKLKNSFWHKKNKIEIISLYDSFFIHKTNVFNFKKNEVNNLYVLSLQQNFIERLWSQIAKNYTADEYKFVIAGLPNWEDFKAVDTLKLPHITFCYSKSFYYEHQKHLTQNLINAYESIFHSKPSDMFLLGYETTKKFTQKIFAHNVKNLFINALNDTIDKVFTNFNFYSKDAWVNINKPTGECIENHHLYFIKTHMGLKTIEETLQ